MNLFSALFLLILCPQKTRSDMCKENLLGELHNVVEDSVNHVMNTEQQDTSKVCFIKLVA